MTLVLSVVSRYIRWSHRSHYLSLHIPPHQKFLLNGFSISTYSCTIIQPMAVQGLSLTRHHPEISYFAVSVAVLICIVIVNATTLMHPGRGVLVQLYFSRDDFYLLPLCLYCQDIGLVSKTQRFFAYTFY